MKIVILDGHVENPGDLSWDALASLGELTVYDRTAPKDVIARIGDAPIVITNKTVITRAILDACPAIRYVGVLATGYNVVDIAAAKEKGIVVTNVPAYSTQAVAQFTMALLLEICHHVGRHSDAVHAGKWSACPDFAFWDYPLIELAGKTIGIIGYGRIGQATAKAAQALGMNVIAYSRHGQGDPYVPLEELYARSDVISLHCPLTENTQGMIGAQAIAEMKPGVRVINTARGPLVDESAMAQALEAGKVACYMADVLSSEPPAADNPLLAARNTILTPHVAWAPYQSRVRLRDTAIANVRAFLEGAPQNVVNG